MTYDSLYQSQDTLLQQVFAAENVLLPGSTLILAGGTALARCHLHHRISWDLDFFVGGPFDPALLLRRLRDAGVALEDPSQEVSGVFVTQLHGSAEVGGEVVNVSFVEDVFAGMFETTRCGVIRTEVIEGLYHRKLRTITGTGEIRSASGHVLGQGARQKARDLFDLYVLEKTVQPIDEFVRTINRHGANFTVEALYQGFAAMPWQDMIDEFEQLEVIEPFERITAFEAKRHFDQALVHLSDPDESVR